jgi:hypothetical protein
MEPSDIFVCVNLMPIHDAIFNHLKQTVYLNN